jgi:hypothetical protein
MQQMLRLAVFAFTIASLTALAAGVLDAVPLVFWGSDSERAAVEQGRTVMLVGTGLTFVAAAALASLGERRFAAVVAAVPLLPVGLAIAADGTAFGLFALWPALSVGFYAAFMACVRAPERARRVPSMAFGLVLPPLVSAVGAVSAGVVAAALMLVAYGLERAAGTTPARAVGALGRAVGYALVTAIAVFAGATLLT